MTVERRVAATRLATSLLFGPEAPAPDPAALDETAFVDVLVRNKAPVGVVGATVVEAVLPEGWRSAREHVAGERERLEAATDEYRAIATAWWDEGVRAVLIKSPGYFPYTSDNVDVLVAPADAARARSVLEDLGYRELPWVREPFKILLRKVCGKRSGFAIHLHTRVAWINSFLQASEVLTPSRSFGGNPVLRRPDADTAFLITTAHWFYEDKEVKLRDLYHSREILRAGVDWDAISSRAGGGGWEDGLTAAIALLRQAAADLGLESLAEQIPAVRPPSSRLVPGFTVETPLAAFPAQIHRRKAKAMHFAKSLRNPSAGAFTRAREVALVGAYALKVRLPALQRAPIFVVAAHRMTGDRLQASLAAAATTLGREFSLPVQVHSEGDAVSPAMLARGGIHVFAGADPKSGSRRRITLRPEEGRVLVEHSQCGNGMTTLDPDDGAGLAAAIAHAYLESIA